MADVHVSPHPLVQHKLTLLRRTVTEPKKFRELVRELSQFLLYEATLDLPLHPLPIETPLAPLVGSEIAARIGLVPILRAGLGMVDPIIELIPTARVWHLGLYRDHATLEPVTYYNKLPAEANIDLCLVLDPMLATGGSATAAVDILKHWGARRIKFLGLIAAPEGVAALSAAHPDVPIHLAAVDDHLNEVGYIVPGLGDAGDRQFGTG
jgi:uracil phosphoribosyltransferase